MKTKDYWIEKLDLQPHPSCKGFFQAVLRIQAADPGWISPPPDLYSGF